MRNRRPPFLNFTGILIYSEPLLPFWGDCRSTSLSPLVFLQTWMEWDTLVRKGFLPGQGLGDLQKLGPLPGIQGDAAPLHSVL